MPAISPVNMQVQPKAQNVNFGAKKQYSDLASEVNADHKALSGGKAKKVLGLGVILAAIGAVVLHKMPADKLPQLLQPVKAKISEAIQWVATKVPKFGKEAAQKGEEVVKPVVDAVV